MARKTTGTSTSTRSKKAAASIQPAPVQVAAEVGLEAGQETPKKGKSGNAAARTLTPFNLEEQIRRRAYELYLERRATSGHGQGDQNQDWLVAEREVRSRFNNQEQRSA